MRRAPPLPRRHGSGASSDLSWHEGRRSRDTLAASGRDRAGRSALHAFRCGYSCLLTKSLNLFMMSSSTMVVIFSDMIQAAW